jgi:hypothetical protein
MPTVLDRYMNVIMFSLPGPCSVKMYLPDMMVRIIGVMAERMCVRVLSRW